MPKIVAELSAGLPTPSTAPQSFGEEHVPRSAAKAENDKDERELRMLQDPAFEPQVVSDDEELSRLKPHRPMIAPPWYLLKDTAFEVRLSYIEERYPHLGRTDKVLCAKMMVHKDPAPMDMEFELRFLANKIQRVQKELGHDQEEYERRKRHLEEYVPIEDPAQCWKRELKRARTF